MNNACHSVGTRLEFLLCCATLKMHPSCNESQVSTLVIQQWLGAIAGSPMYKILIYLLRRKGHFLFQETFHTMLGIVLFIAVN